MTDKPDVMIARITELLATKRYDWARSTLEGIRATIQQNGRVTLRQQEAVEHVMIGRLKHDVR
jgi:hypothetical protein